MFRFVGARALATLVIFLTCPPAVCRATTCGPTSACIAITGGSVVFLGRAASEMPQADGSILTRFAVKEVFNGKVAAEAAVLSGPDIGGDTLRFKDGEDYLVVAQDEAGRLVIGGICGPTKPATLAVADLKFLRARASKSLPRTILYGTVAMMEQPKEGEFPSIKPLAGKTVSATGPSGSFQTTTGPDGYFEFREIPPGAFEVAPKLPDTMLAEKAQVKIGPEGCGAAVFWAWWDGQISGRAVSTDGRPVADAEMDLSNVRLPPGQATGGRTQDDGSYSFDHLQPGRYVVGLLTGGILDVPSQEFPFPPLFYPDAEDRESATVIELGPGQKLQGMNFIIRRFEPRLIRVQIQWPDKRPVAGAKVSVEYEQTYCWKRGCAAPVYYTTDKKGRAAFYAYGDGRIRVYAVARDRSGANWISEFGELDLRNLPFATYLVMKGPDTYDEE
jgi:hypothetical protein